MIRVRCVLYAWWMPPSWNTRMTSSIIWRRRTFYIYVSLMYIVYWFLHIEIGFIYIHLSPVLRHSPRRIREGRGRRFCTEVVMPFFVGKSGRGPRYRLDVFYTCVDITRNFCLTTTRQFRSAAIRKNEWEVADCILSTIYMLRNRRFMVQAGTCRSKIRHTHLDI